MRAIDISGGGGADHKGEERRLLMYRDLVGVNGNRPSVQLLPAADIGASYPLRGLIVADKD